MRRQQKKPAKRHGDADALFMGTGLRAISRKSMLPGYTVADLQQFLVLLYGMFDEKEAKEVIVSDPFASERGRRITIARLANAIEHLVEIHQQKSA